MQPYNLAFLNVILSLPILTVVTQRCAMMRTFLRSEVRLVVGAGLVPILAWDHTKSVPMKSAKEVHHRDTEVTESSRRKNGWSTSDNRNFLPPRQKVFSPWSPCLCVAFFLRRTFESERLCVPALWGRVGPGLGTHEGRPYVGRLAQKCNSISASGIWPIFGRRRVRTCDP